MSDFSIPLAFETIYIYITKVPYEESTFAFDHLHLPLAYDIFVREILQIETIVLLYFEDI